MYIQCLLFEQSRFKVLRSKMGHPVVLRMKKATTTMRLSIGLGQVGRKEDAILVRCEDKFTFTLLMVFTHHFCHPVMDIVRF